MNQNRNFQVGERVVFRMTSGGSVIGRTFGTVLAIGETMERSDSGPSDGAIVAWEPDRFSSSPHDYRVDFCPFWNMRFSALPEIR